MTCNYVSAVIFATRDSHKITIQYLSLQRESMKQTHNNQQRINILISAEMWQILAGSVVSRMVMS